MIPGRMLSKLLIAAVASSACAPLSTKPVRPPLPPVVERIPDGEIYAKCFRAFPLWQHILFFPLLPLGCSERDGRTCTIWAGETATDSVIEHEKKHCQGYEHIL